jgi:two-component system nitrate/nitrite sensor histidine kinase NarX
MATYPPKPPEPAGSSGGRETQFEHLSDLSALISQSENLVKILDRTLDQLLILTGADIGSVHLLDGPAGALKMAASRGVSGGFICKEEVIPHWECLCGEAARTGRLVVSRDLGEEPRLVRQACREEGFRSVVSIPLKSREEVLGVLTIYGKKETAFQEIDHEMIGLVSRQIGVAIENALLYAHARKTAIQSERGLIAREIHDGIAQSLAYLNLETRRFEQMLTLDDKQQALVELGKIRQGIRDAYEDVRGLLVDFRAKFRDGEGLVEALERHLEVFRERTGIRTHFENRSPSSSFSPSPTVQIQLFHIVLESLSNIRRHAGAKEISVILSETREGLELSIRDDGRGFDFQDPYPERNGNQFGLEIMKERAAMIAARLEWESKPGGGTRLTVVLPFSSFRDTRGEA